MDERDQRRLTAAIERLCAAVEEKSRIRPLEWVLIVGILLFLGTYLLLAILL